MLYLHKNAQIKKLVKKRTFFLHRGWVLSTLIRKRLWKIACRHHWKFSLPKQRISENEMENFLILFPFYPHVRPLSQKEDSVVFKWAFAFFSKISEIPVHPHSWISTIKMKDASWGQHKLWPSRPSGLCNFSCLMRTEDEWSVCILRHAGLAASKFILKGELQCLGTEFHLDPVYSENPWL